MKRSSRVFAVILASALSALALTGCSGGGSGTGGAAGTPTVPGLTGLTDNVSGVGLSQSKSDASSLSNACKNLYAEVVSGTMNSSSPKAFPGLPAANASPSTKKRTALQLTISNAMEYAGLSYLSSALDDFVVDTSTATIYSRLDDSKPSTATTPVTPDTTMKDLGYK